MWWTQGLQKVSEFQSNRFLFSEVGRCYRINTQKANSPTATYKGCAEKSNTLDGSSTTSAGDRQKQSLVAHALSQTGDAAPAMAPEARSSAWQKAPPVKGLWSPNSFTNSLLIQGHPSSVQGCRPRTTVTAIISLVSGWGRRTCTSSKICVLRWPPIQVSTSVTSVF